MTICGEVRPLFDPPRTFQRTIYRPGEICQFDVWEPEGRDCGRSRPDAQGVGRDRVPGLLARGRRRADLLQADRGSAGRDPPLLVVAGGAAADAGLGSPGRVARRRRPADQEFAAFCGQLRIDWRFCDAGDPQAKGVVERLQDFPERSFEPGRVSANELDYQLQLDGWFDSRPIPGSTRRCAAARSTASPRSARRWRRCQPQRRTPIAAGCCASRPIPYLRLDTNDYSLDPRASRAPRRGPRLRAGSSRGRAGHRRARLPPPAQSFAQHQTITALEHARTLKPSAQRRCHASRSARRSLAAYDALIA